MYVCTYACICTQQNCGQTEALLVLHVTQLGVRCNTNVLYCTVLYILYCTVLYCTVLYILYCTVLYCTYCTVLYCTVLYCTYCTVLYCTVLYCTVLYCTVLYCTVLYCTIQSDSLHANLILKRNQPGVCLSFTLFVKFQNLLHNTLCSLL